MLLLGRSCEQFYFIVFCWLVYLRASRSCPDAQVWKLIHLQTPLDWTGQGMTGKSASQPILQCPGKEPSSLLRASMLWQSLQRLSCCYIQGRHQYGPRSKLSCVRRPQEAQTGPVHRTVCSQVHCLGPTWASPCLHACCAKCHASACVHFPMSHRISPTKLRLKDRKHLLLLLLSYFSHVQLCATP